MWMVNNQRMQVLDTHMINKAKVRGIICEQKGKIINYWVFGDWMMHDHFRDYNLLNQP
jgi:hypothetical protein